MSTEDYQVLSQSSADTESSNLNEENDQEEFTYKDTQVPINDTEPNSGEESSEQEPLLEQPKVKFYFNGQEFEGYDTGEGYLTLMRVMILRGDEGRWERCDCCFSQEQKHYMIVPLCKMAFFREVLMPYDGSNYCGHTPDGRPIYKRKPKCL